MRIGTVCFVSGPGGWTEPWRRAAAGREGPPGHKGDARAGGAPEGDWGATGTPGSWAGDHSEFRLAFVRLAHGYSTTPMAYAGSFSILFISQLYHTFNIISIFRLLYLFFPAVSKMSITSCLERVNHHILQNYDFLTDWKKKNKKQRISKSVCGYLHVCLHVCLEQAMSIICLLYTMHVWWPCLSENKLFVIIAFSGGLHLRVWTMNTREMTKLSKEPNSCSIRFWESEKTAIFSCGISLLAVGHV